MRIVGALLFIISVAAAAAIGTAQIERARTQEIKPLLAYYALNHNAPAGTNRFCLEKQVLFSRSGDAFWFEGRSLLTLSLYPRFLTFETIDSASSFSRSLSLDTDVVDDPGSSTYRLSKAFVAELKASCLKSGISLEIEIAETSVAKDQIDAAFRRYLQTQSREYALPVAVGFAEARLNSDHPESGPWLRFARALGSRWAAKILRDMPELDTE